MQKYAHFLYFNIIFADIPRFFRQGKINCWGGQDRKITAPVSALVSALYMSFGSQRWTALFDLVDKVGPKVLCQGQYQYKYMIKQYIWTIRQIV